MPNVWPAWVSQETTSGAYFLTHPNAGTNISTWNVWVTQTTGTTLPIDPWHAWQNQVITPQYTGTAASSIWINWQDLGTIRDLGGIDLPAYTPTELTPEQKAHRARQDLIYRNRNRARGIRDKIAARTAEKLLLENLSAKQREEWKAERAFHVETADGQRRYRIAYGLAGNVKLVHCDGPAPLSKRGHPVRVGSKFCMHVYHPEGHVPNEDNVLAQKLLLESNEAQFLALANVS